MEQIVERVTKNRLTNRTTTSDTRTIEEKRIATGEGRKTSTEEAEERKRQHRDPQAPGPKAYKTS